MSAHKTQTLAAMDSFQTMTDREFMPVEMGNFNTDIMNSIDHSMMNNLDYSLAYSNDIQMDLGDVSAVPFDSVEPNSDNLKETDQQPENGDGLPMSGVGAGPLPTGFGAQAGSNAGSTLTEFTKRRNWSQRVVEEIKDFLSILTPDGRLLYVSPSTKSLTGYESSDLTGKLVSEFLHPDDQALFVREFNESIATGNQLRFFYRFRNADNKFQIFEGHGHPHLTNDVSHMELSGGPVNSVGFCRGFFMMSRPYPTKNAGLLDSFLEHKIENERLRARIDALKREEAEEAEAQARHFHRKANGHGSITPTDSQEMTPRSPSMTSRGDSSGFTSMPPPAKPTVSNVALTREALDEANAFARPDSITDKMARYEGSSHVDSIEMLTGLRYREGERSQGISTGGQSPALIRGDAGIDIPADKTDPRYGGNPYLDKKSKKVKSADEYVCTDCGTLDSPEWRKGPNGPKTLCNACGLRWAKKEKKKSGPTGGNANNGDNGSNPSSGNNTVQHNMPAVPRLKHNSSSGSH